MRSVLERLPRAVVFALTAAAFVFADSNLDLLVSTRRYREAVEYAEARLPADKRTAAVWVNVGRAYEALMYNEKGLESYLAALRAKSNEVSALLGAARLYNVLGRHQDAVYMADKAFKARASAEAGWELARAHIALKKPAEAKRALEAVIAIDTANVTANRELGTIYFGENEYARALPLLRRSYRSDPIGADAFMIGASYGELGIHDSAAVYSRIAVERRARVREAALYLARAHFARGRYGDAAAEYSRSDKSMMTALDYHRYGVALDKTRNAAGAFEAHLTVAEKFKDNRSREALLSREYLARTYLNRDEPAAALPHLEFIAAADRRAAVVKDAHILLADAYAGTNQNDKAISSLERAIALAPRSIEAYVRLTELYEKTGQSERAKGTHDLMMSISPNDPAVFMTLGYYNLNAGRWAEALRHFEKSNSYNRSGAAFEGVAIAALGLGDHKKTLEAARAAITLNPNLIVAREAMARAMIAGGEFAKALEQAEWISQKEPNNVGYLRLVAECYEGMSNWAKLAEVDKKIAEADKKDIPSRLRLAKYAQGRNDLRRAVAAHREIIAVDPDFPESHKQLAALLRARKNPAAALVHAEKYVALRPNDAEGYRELGDIHYDQKKHDAALKAYRTALKLDPNLKGFHKRYAEILTASGQTAEVIAALKGVIESGEADIGTYTTLGTIHAGQRRFREAIEMYAEALKLDPSNFDALAALASAQVAAGNIDAAIASYERAVALKPDAGQEYRALGDLYMRQKRDADGLAAYTKYLDNTRGGDKIIAETVGRMLYENKKFAAAAKYLAQAELKEPAALLMYADASLQSGGVRRAVETLEALRARRPRVQNIARVLALLGDAYEKEKRPADAAKIYAEYIALPGVKDADIAYKAAFLQEGTDPAAAVRIYESNIRVYPNDVRNHLRLAFIYSRQKETQPRAAPLFQRYAAAAAAAPQLWLELAGVYNALNRDSDELDAYLRYVKTDTAHAESNKRIGALLMRNDAVDSAMAYLSRAAAAAPDDHEIMALLAQGHSRTGRAGEAVELLEKARAARPNDIGIRRQLYEAYVQAGQAAKAFEEIKHLALTTKDGRFMLQYGEALISRGRVREAETIADDLLFQDPENIDALMLQGKVLRTRREWDAAIDIYKKVTEINPGMAAAYYERAETFMQAGKPTWAETFYKRALRADPRLGLAELGLARLYKGRKQMDLYRQHLEAAQKLLPDNAQVAEELRRAR